MSLPPVTGKLRTADFPTGIVNQTDVQRLGAILNPLLERLKNMGTSGVSIAQNIDGQIVTFPLTTPSTDWTQFTLAAGTNTVGRELSWRTDANGASWLRGKLATVPAIAIAIATLPAAAAPATIQRFAVDANGAYGAIEITAAGVISQVVGSVAGTLDINCSFVSVKNTPGILSCFPTQMRVKDSRRPKAVILMSCLDHTQGNPANTPNTGSTTPSILVPGLQWSYAQSGTGQSFISVDGMPGLSLNRTYDVSLLVLY